jgi:hypothetical protein
MSTLTMPDLLDATKAAPTMATSPRLDALRRAIRGIAEQAAQHAEADTCEDACDVLEAIGSACRVALSEHYGYGPEVDQ